MSEPTKTDIVERLQDERPNEAMIREAVGEIANNLCPDHRDKQAGKSCLACEIERLREKVDELECTLDDEEAAHLGTIRIKDLAINRLAVAVEALEEIPIHTTLDCARRTASAALTRIREMGGE